ncbi:MAG: hypothetical protein K1X35_14620, partial [Caulobacteraceae bacterium]|nr:hypothetical protein [Caulobacteraceae bacterium]
PKTPPAAAAAAREQLLAAVRARYAAEQAAGGGTPRPKKKGCGCMSWLIPLAAAIYFILKVLLAPDPDRPAQPAVPSAGVGAETASSPTPAEDEPPTITADTDSGGGR